jgi:hypothetical protein
MVGLQAVCEVGARVAARLGLPEPVQQALYNLWECWNGKGPRGLRGHAIPLYARIALAAFIIDSFAQDRGPEAAAQAVLAERGRALDPEIVGGFEELSRRPQFWSFLNDPNLWAHILDLEADSPYRYVEEARLDAVAAAFADFADLKSPSSRAHLQQAGGLESSGCGVLRHAA